MFMVGLQKNNCVLSHQTFAEVEDFKSWITLLRDYLYDIWSLDLHTKVIFLGNQVL